MASTLVSGARKLAVWNPNAGSAEIVQIDADFLYEVEAQKRNAEPDQTSPTGGVPFAGDDSTLSFESSDFDPQTQFETWAQNDTPVSALIVGYQDVFQWYEEDIITTSRVPIYDRAGQLQGLRLEINRTGHGQHDVYAQANALLFAGWRGSDDDSDGVPDNYTNSNFTSTAFTDDDSDGTAEQFEGYAPTGGGEAYIAKDVEWPVQGIEVTLSALFNQLHNDGTTAIEIQLLDFSGSVLSTQTTTVGSTGRASVTMTPSGTDAYQLRCKVAKVSGASANTAKVQVADPTLSVNGATTYLNF